MELMTNKLKLNLSTNKGNDNIVSDSILDTYFENSNQHSKTKYSILNESASEITDAAMKAFSNMGIIVSDTDTNTDDPQSHKNVIERVNTYLKRFPEMDYIIDMIASSTIYASSSNTKKIQCTLKGDYLVYKGTDGTSFIDKTNSELDINVDINEIQNVKVDSWQDELNLEIGNLFKNNNIKSSLYEFIKSIIKYGCGVFYIDDLKNYKNISFYSLDELDFSIDKKTNVNTNAVLNELENEKSTIFKSTGYNNDIKMFDSKIIVYSKEENKKLNVDKLHFVSDKGAFGKSKVMKIIHYLKIIELLELSLLIERLSKTRTTHVWKLDVANIEEEDLSSTLLLYKNLLKSNVALNYDSEGENMQFDFIKNLVDNNILAPTEEDNLKIDTLKSEFKPLLDDVSYYQDKIYLSMGLPSYYRNSDTRVYTNSNMLIIHDNVYSMKIRHYQIIVNNILTYQIENYISRNFKNVNIKYININIPEFIPLSERKETDIDKAGKFIDMFTQLQTTLNVKLKTDFMLNKLFPNDIISDIIDLQSDNLDENENDNIDERLLKLLEDKKQINKSESFNIFKVLKNKSIKDKIYDIIKCNINLNINW